MRAFSLFLTALFFATLLTAGVGCRDKTSSSYLRNNYTPELHSQVRNEEQFYNDGHRHADHMRRTIWDDLQRMWLRDKNTQLSPIPVP